MNWWHYLLLANIYLTLFFSFYMLFLRKETFFNLNRVYLVGGAILSFALPLVQSAWVKQLFITQKVQQTILQVNPGVIYQVNVAAVAHTQRQVTLGEALAALYGVGILFFFCRFLYQLIQLQVDILQPKAPSTFSFFNKIRIEESDADNIYITAHEEAHARQWHSADIILIEAVTILNWFNPVVYLYRNAIRHIHEFIADRDALHDGADKAEYAMLLVAQTFHAPPHRMVNPFFNNSMLKERIKMLQKNRSARIMLFKYWLSAPLFMLMLILSSATVNNSKAVNAIQSRAQQVFAAPAINTLTGYHSGEIPEELSAPNNSTQPFNTKNIKDYTALEQTAEFPGGLEAFYAFLAMNVHYPQEVDAQGKVLVSFIIEKDGALSNFKITQSLAPAFDNEALRVVKLSPKWHPAVQNGQPIREQFTVPISFTLFANNVKKAPVVKPAPQPENDNEVFTAVEQSASFPGGIEAFYHYLFSNIRYPEEARTRNVQGKVFLTFIVERDGSISNIKVLRGIGSGCDEEAIRVLGNMPKWNPGLQNGYAIRQQYTVPISFSLVDSHTSNSKAPADSTARN